MTIDPAAFVQYGLGGILALALLGLLWRVGNAIVAALDRVSTKLDAHTENDNEGHSETRADLAVIRGMLEERRATPVEGVPIQRNTPPYGSPTTYHKRARTRGEDE